MKKNIFFLIAALICSVQNITAQTTEKIPCPSVVLNGPASYTVEEGDSLIFKVSPLGKAYDKAGITYNWAISTGTIVEGQGTSRININTAGLKGQTITATVEVGGVDPTCPSTSSSSVDVIEKVAKPRAKPQAKPKPKSKTAAKKS